MKVKIDDVQITGIASCLPKTVKEIDSLSDVFGEKQIRRLKKSTGVERLHIVSDGQTASDLCVAASEHLISQLGISKESIDGLVFVSFSPDYKGPPTSVVMQDRLGLRQEIVAFDITYACSAYCYGLYQASMLVKTGGCKRVLVCTGDTQSRMINPKDRAMQVILGDAGTATLVEDGGDCFSFYLKTLGNHYQDLIILAGGYRLPYSDETSKEYTDDVGNVRSQNDLYMDGMGVMNFALTEVPVAVNELLEFSGLAKNDIALFAMHQPNKLILDHLAMSMEIPEEKMPVGLQNTGNTASATIPLLLSVLKERGASFCKMDKVLCCGFGMGLSVSAAVMDLGKTEILRPILK